jgi:hypothetical protein
LLLGVTGWKLFRSASPKTTLPLTENTTGTVERVIPFEHPFPNRQTKSASTLLNDARCIGNVRDWHRVRESENRIYLASEVNFRF